MTGERTPALRELYARVLEAPERRVEVEPLPDSVLWRELRFRDATLVVWINEGAADVSFVAGGHTLELRAGDALLGLFDAEGALLDESG